MVKSKHENMTFISFLLPPFGKYPYTGGVVHATQYPQQNAPRFENHAVRGRKRVEDIKKAKLRCYAGQLSSTAAWSCNAYTGNNA